MLDDVLRWLVQVTGLEPKLLTLTAILMVYAASVYLNAKKGVAGVAPAQAAQRLEFADLTSTLARVESGVETVAKYLVNLEKYLDDVRLYGSFLTPYVPPQEESIPPRRPRPEKYPSIPPRSRSISPEAGIHIGQDIEEDEPYFPIPAPSITPKSKQTGFFLPVPQAEPYQPEPQPEETLPEPEEDPQPEQENQHQQEPQEQPEPVPLSPAVMKKMLGMSRKAGRIP